MISLQIHTIVIILLGVEIGVPKNTGLVDHNEVNKFINDHSTVRVLPSNVQVGDKVVYYSEGAPIHSAVVYSISGNEITCQSKWGEGYIFIHKLDKVPLEYYDQDDGTRFLNVEYYRYTHPDHEHSLYVLSESGVSKVIRCNESDCTYYAVCTHLSTYTDLSALEHTRTCSNGGFVFAEWHDSDVVASDNLYYHNIECLDCGRLIDTENHDWVSTGSLYSCSVCGMTSAVVPEIMRNLTNDEINLLLSTMSNDETDALLLALNDADRKRVTDALAPIENDDNVTE